MVTNQVRTVPPRGEPASPPVSTDRELLTSFEEDAARSRGDAAGVARPRSEAEVVALLATATRERRSILPQGARSSLTAGATPRGDIVLDLEGMTDFALAASAEGGTTARVGPGLRLRDLNERLAPSGLWFPPVPTYDLCCMGGAVATNAAGAATFKYGPVRSWVRALRVVLATGDVVALRRGQYVADEAFVLHLARRARLVGVPRYRTPDLKKVACGYFARPDVDLVDLFVGSEGTLGVVTEVEVDLAVRPASVVTGIAAFADERSAFAFTADARRASEETWRTKDPAGIDVRALEWIDSPSLELLRARGKVSETEPPSRGGLVLFEQELPPDAAAADRALEALGAVLARHGAEDTTRIALPGDETSRRAITRIREVVPETVNDLVAERKRADPGVRKVAGDMVVPFERLEEMLGHYRAAFARRGLASAIWGHISDGNLHPNVLARTAAEAKAGDEALLELGDIARALGGAPLSEHGVGKSPTKQELLRRFYGDEAIGDMADLKVGLDPRGVLAPGNIFPRERLRYDESWTT
ncbi:MAG: FAD-binding oxidoreductase [Planctomycetota bacterium]